MRQLRARSGFVLFPVGDLVLPLLVVQADAVGDFLQQLDLLLLPFDELLEQTTISSLASILLLTAARAGRPSTSMLNMGENRRGSWDIGEVLLGILSIYTRRRQCRAFGKLCRLRRS